MNVDMRNAWLEALRNQMGFVSEDLQKASALTAHDQLGEATRLMGAAQLAFEEYLIDIGLMESPKQRQRVRRSNP